jgi:hypothetical protein
MQTAAVRNLATFPAPDEAQTQALTADIQAQLAGIPKRVTDMETCRLAKESLPVLKRFEDRVTTFFKPLKDAAHKAHKVICDKETEQLSPIKAARAALSSQIIKFEQEQERQRRERERQAQEEERRRLESAAIAEAESIAATAPDVADQILEQAIAAPSPIVTMPRSTIAVTGVSTAANWQWRFMGCPAGLEWDKLPDEDRQRVMRLLPREYLRPDERAISKVVKALKGSSNIPGIEPFDAGSVRVRA